jgi:Domain of unknown function (DUF4440)
MVFFRRARYRKSIVSFLTTVFFFATATNVMTASSKRKPSPIQIVWSNSREVIAVYELSPLRTDRVKVRLIVRRTIETVTKVWPGGIDALSALAEGASKEAASLHSKANKGDYWRKLTVTFSQGGRRQSFSLEGEMNELFAFFYRTRDLKALLKLASYDAPKAYRLIDEGGNTSLPQSADETALLKMIRLRDEAIRKRDANVLDRILADEYMGVGSSSKADLLSLVKNTKVIYQTVSSEGLALKFYGDAATVTGIFETSGIDGRGRFKEEIEFLEAWGRDKGQWRLLVTQMKGYSHKWSLISD